MSFEVEFSGSGMPCQRLFNSDLLMAIISTSSTEGDGGVAYVCYMSFAKGFELTSMVNMVFTIFQVYNRYALAYATERSHWH